MNCNTEAHQETLIHWPAETLEVIERVGLDNVRISVDFGGTEIGIRPLIEIEKAFRKFATTRLMFTPRA